MFFIPFKIDRPFGIPWATIALIVTNTFIWMVSLANPYAFAQFFGFRPDVSGLYTWFTSMFVHADFFHLAGNMYFLWLFGSVIEDATGWLKYLALYAAGGLAAGLTSAAVTVVFSPSWTDVPMIGASGAIAALIGIFAIRFYHHKVSIFYFIFFTAGVFALPSLAAVALWFIREVVYAVPILLGQFTGVASFAHIGGLLFGVGLAFATGLGREADVEDMAAKAVKAAAEGDHAVAVETYRLLAAEDPGEPKYALGRIRELWLAGRLPQDEAAAQAARVLKRMFFDGRREEAVTEYLALRGRGLAPALDPHTEMKVAAYCETSGRLSAAAHTYYRLATGCDEAALAEKALFRLAHVYLGMGHRDLAAQTWASFVATYPDSEWRAWADRTLEGPGGT
ncbi:MAG: hypothetical protein Kow0056_09980 [Coriobacteriia bacterium]